MGSPDPWAQLGKAGTWQSTEGIQVERGSIFMTGEHRVAEWIRLLGLP